VEDLLAWVYAIRYRNRNAMVLVSKSQTAVGDPLLLDIRVCDSSNIQGDLYGNE
jgi:hypothetical protein